MSSNVVPQAALFVVPRNPTVAPPKKLAFPPCISRRPTASPQLSVSSSSTSSFNSLLGSEKSLRSRSFVVRAEEGGEAAEAEPAAASSEIAEEAAEAEAEAEAEEENEAEAEVEKTPPKPRIKLGDIMGILNKRAIEASDEARLTPDIRTGDIVEIKLEVPENRRRLSVYKGIVISKQNAGIHTTIRIRRIIAGIGVEIVFPVYSPNIKEIKVVSHRKVRRARLYYLREKLPRLSTFK